MDVDTINEGFHLTCITPFECYNCVDSHMRYNYFDGRPLNNINLAAQFEIKIINYKKTNIKYF